MQSDWLMDLGHSRVKWVLARDGEVVDESPRSCPLAQLDALASDLASDQGQRVWLSSQSAPNIVDSVTALVQNHGLSLQIVRLGAFDMPIKPAYSTLGCDRWLAIQWPWKLTGSSFCVIDCGTAVTFDMVSDRGVHLGGWIMAGLNVLRRGLFEQAPGLAELSASGNPSEQAFLPPATDSARAIAAGTMCQVSAALDRALDVATDLLGGPPRVWVTGGDGRQIAGFLNTPATLDDMLVLRGLALVARAS